MCTKPLLDGRPRDGLRAEASGDGLLDAGHQDLSGILGLNNPHCASAPSRLIPIPPHIGQRRSLADPLQLRPISPLPGTRSLSHSPTPHHS
ncbi:hypothetical protein EYF80_042701 [Liparis tanakae]|uniref:Uncharacterized protein n=1 Tax=Liparis tanakae TaxID=230148 RepID=A0A4Z2G0P9_9TELE|nr:hypothetical protein EYF80_042701 [Liparis tanakae]